MVEFSCFVWRHGHFSRLRGPLRSAIGGPSRSGALRSADSERMGVTPLRVGKSEIRMVNIHIIFERKNPRVGPGKYPPLRVNFPQINPGEGNCTVTRDSKGGNSTSLESLVTLRLPANQIYVTFHGVGCFPPPLLKS